MTTPRLHPDADALAAKYGLEFVEREGMPDDGWFVRAGDVKPGEEPDTRHVARMYYTFSSQPVDACRIMMKGQRYDSGAMLDRARPLEDLVHEFAAMAMNATLA